MDKKPFIEQLVKILSQSTKNYEVWIIIIDYYKFTIYIETISNFFVRYL